MTKEELEKRLTTVIRHGDKKASKGAKHYGSDKKKRGNRNGNKES